MSCLFQTESTQSDPFKSLVGCRMIEFPSRTLASLGTMLRLGSLEESAITGVVIRGKSVQNKHEEQTAQVLRTISW